MSVINAIPMLLGGEGYEISRSVRLRSSASAYFNRTPASAGNLSTWTWSAWVKRGTLSSGYQVLYMGGNTVDNNSLSIYFSPTDTFQIQGYTTTYYASTQVFRDPSAWYHIVVALDSTQATQANRCKVYVNGVLISASTNAFPLNGTWNLNSNLAQTIGYQSAVWGFNYFDGYMTEINFVNAQQLAPSSFGETDAVTGVWKPKKYAGTYGTNGFYLNFSDNSSATATTIGKDNSGNGNNWTPNNISVTSGVTYDSMIDSPTMYADGGNGRGNYATLNPLGRSSTAVLADGNLALSNSTLNTYPAASTGIYPASGSWYFEATFTGSGTQECSVGMSNLTTFASSTHQTTAGNVYWNSNNGIYKDGSVFSGGAGKTFTYGDVIGVAYDIAAGTITFYKNGTAQTPVVTGVGASYSPTLGFNYYTAGVLHLNCGQRPFAYTPPTGFKALNTQNLPDSTIKKGNQFFDATTYTGNGTSLSVVNAGAFQPDLVWVKSRSQVADHGLQDSVRGTPILYPNLTSAESTGGFWISSYNSNGFTLNNNTAGNNSGSSYVGWQWKAGGTAVSNTSGTITSSVSANTSAGFSVATYTGNATNNATFGHGLGVAPAMVIIKNRAASTFWYVFHSSLPATYNLYLNDTAAQQADNVIRSTSSTTVTVSSSSAVNASGQSMVAYCFAEVAGYSKFGSYTGNGSADGPFVYCGFRPRFLLVKRTDSATNGNWEIIDTARDTYNQAFLDISANLSAVENATDGAAWDILSNGFKCRDGSSTGTKNVSGGTYIFAAFAENPFKNSLAR